MKFIFVICLIFFQSLIQIHAETDRHEVRLVAKIKTSGNKIQVMKGKEASKVLTKVSGPQVLEDLKKLEPGDEALITGRIDYERKGTETGSLQPVFLIESIRPISLKRLGDIGHKFVEAEGNIVMEPHTDFAPKTLPVTGEVANAITITAGLLMLQDLTKSETTPKIKQDLNTGLIFSAGVLATGLFIYEQISGKKSPK